MPETIDQRLDRIEADLAMSIRLQRLLCGKLGLAEEADEVFAKWEADIDERRRARAGYGSAEEETSPGRPSVAPVGP